MKRSILLLACTGMLSFTGIASPRAKACVKKTCATQSRKQQALKKQDQPAKWTSVLSGPFDSFIYRLFK